MIFVTNGSLNWTLYSYFQDSEVLLIRTVVSFFVYCSSCLYSVGVHINEYISMTKVAGELTCLHCLLSFRIQLQVFEIKLFLVY